MDVREVLAMLNQGQDVEIDESGAQIVEGERLENSASYGRGQCSISFADPVR